MEFLASSVVMLGVKLYSRLLPLRKWTGYGIIAGHRAGSERGAAHSPSERSASPLTIGDDGYGRGGPISRDVTGTPHADRNISDVSGANKVDLTSSMEVHEGPRAGDPASRPPNIEQWLLRRQGPVVAGLTILYLAGVMISCADPNVATFRGGHDRVIESRAPKLTNY